MTAATWALGDTVLDASWNELTSSGQLTTITLALWTTLREEGLALDTTSWAISKQANALLALEFDAEAAVGTAVGKLAALEVVLTQTEFAAAEAVALAAGSDDITSWLADACTVLHASAWSH